jgi:hypothetical protein
LALAGLTLFAVALAVPAARSSTGQISKAVIPPQYQAKNASQVVGAEPHGFIAGPSRGGATGVAAEADLFKSATWYHSVPLRYQLPRTIAGYPFSTDNTYRTLSVKRTVSDTALGKPISIGGAGLDQKDARLLFRLGLVLAAAYAVFLVVWLWRTRVRPHHRRRAVRY